MKVMIVEDDENLCSTIEFALTKNGHEVVGIALDGEEALEKYKEIRPQLVIIDLILPKVHGIDVITKIIEIEPNAKIIAITGASHDSLITKAIDVGARTYLTKPFGPKELMDAIDQIS